MDDSDRSLDLSGFPDDLDAISSLRPVGGASRTRFQPKLKGKIHASPSADPLPLPFSSPPLSNDEELSKASEDATEAAVELDPMEIDDEADGAVVREIDVYYTPPPLADDTQLYVMQYPLRPSWRPYELNERCEEVRLKPKQSKIEVDLSIDVHCENYDPDVADSLRLLKQTLTSSKAPLLTDYAVGIMLGSKLHLNPIHEVVQLRPSMSHVGEQPTRKHNKHKPGVNTKSSEDTEETILGQPSRQPGSQVPADFNEKIDDYEPWVSLEYHAIDSPLSGKYQQKMMGEADNHIGFTMKPSDYINSLCPRTNSEKKENLVNRSVLLSMPLEERLKTWFGKGCQVNRFTALKYLAPSNSEDEVLEVLMCYADLVQGLWVSKSSLLYEGRDAQIRDYILLLFNKSHTVGKDKLKELKISDDSLRAILQPLAVERPKLNDWKFRETADDSFKRQHPKVVEEQERTWSNRENDLMDIKRGPVIVKNSQNLIPTKRSTVSSKVDINARRSKGGTGSSTSTTMSNEAREALPKALLKLFQVQKVHRYSYTNQADGSVLYKQSSLKSITQEIRKIALQKSSSVKEDQETRIFVNAANGVSSGSPELKAIISELAVDIHGVYVLKSIGNLALDQLRNVVIGLFLKKKPNAKLEKKEIEQSAKSLQRNISDSEYNQVLNELCSNIKGAWVLKSVD